MKYTLLILAALASLLIAAPAQTVYRPIENPKLTGTGSFGGLSTKTGSGNLVLATSPTLVTPTLGVATATSINGLTITTTTGTITLGANTLTISRNVTLTSDGTGTRTLNIAAGGTLGTAAFTDASAYIATGGATTGTGNVVYSTSPTLVTPVLGSATATSLTASSSLTTHAMKFGYTTQTATYSALTTDYCVNCTSGTFTVTLPSAIGTAGQVYVVKNNGAGTITVATTSSQIFDSVAASGGGTTKTLSAGVALRVMSDGANWIVL